MDYFAHGSGRAQSPPVGVLVAFLVIILVVIQVIAHSISEDSAVRAAEAMGYTDVEVTGRHTFFPGFQGCGEGDLVKFDVSGTDPNGIERTFFVCRGTFKGATVRFG